MKFYSLFITSVINKDKFLDLTLQNYDKILEKYEIKNNYYQKDLLGKL